MLAVCHIIREWRWKGNLNFIDEARNSMSRDEVVMKREIVCQVLRYFFTLFSETTHTILKFFFLQYGLFQSIKQVL